MSRAHGARPACSLAICFAPVASYLPCVATITLMSVAMENKCWVRHETHVATSPAFLMSRAHRGSTACVHARHRSPVVRAARSAGPSPLSFRLWWRPPAARAPMWRAHVEEAQHAEVQDVSEARYVGKPRKQRGRRQVVGAARVVVLRSLLTGTGWHLYVAIPAIARRKVVECPVREEITLRVAQRAAKPRPCIV